MSEGEPEDVIYCQQCGQQLLATANFCDRCGNEVDAETQTSPSTSETLGPGEWPLWKQLVGVAIGTVAIAVVGSFLLGLSSPTHEIAGEGSWSGEQSSSTFTSQTTSGTVTLDAGKYHARTITLERSVNYDITVDTRSGGPIDHYFMERSEFNAYQEGNEFVLLQSLSADSVSTQTLSGTVASGEYVIVFDNTGQYGASPSGKAVVDVTMEASV